MEIPFPRVVKDNHQIIQLYRGRVARYDAGAETVDHALQDDIPHGDETLLQDTGNCNNRNLCKYLKRKDLRFPFHLNPPQTPEDHQHGQHTADPLA